MKNCIRLLAVAVLYLCSAKLAFAHSVYIFAWVDGAQICTESYFTRNSKVMGGEVIMSDLSGNALASGITDNNGLLCFSLPDKAQPLEFSVLAGAGHKGNFRLEEKDLASAIEARGAKAENSPTGIQGGQAINLEETRPVGQTAVSPSGNPAKISEIDLNSEALIRQIVQEELQKQLSPLRQYLAEKLEDNTPGIKEILGGIGWLLGLGAIGSWYAKRRKKL